jgi:hypothetical protein
MLRAITLPQPTAAERLSEAVAFARGNSYIQANPDLAGPEHAFALLQFQAKIENAE